MIKRVLRTETMSELAIFGELSIVLINLFDF